MRLPNNYQRFLRLNLVLFGLLTLSLSLFVQPTQAATGDGSLSDTNIQYVGRWDKSSTTTYTGYWGGAYFKVNFTGTTVKIKLASSANFYAEIDGGLPVNYSGATGTVNLTPTALASGTHSLRVSTAYASDSLSFQGLILDSGATTQPPAVASDIIEFVGDSIMAGQGTSKQALTDYAWLTGEQLHTEHTQIAYPGRCLTNCSTPAMSDQFFKLQATGSTNWDFSTYQPSVVVINIGRNDYRLGVTDATFQSVYTTFLQNIRAKYPAAQILILRTFRGDLAVPTQAAVIARNNAGDAKVHYVDTTNWLTTSDFQSDGIHPNDCGQFKAANLLTPIVNPYLHNPADLSDIVLDNTSSGFNTEGSWNINTSAPGYYGCNYAVDSTSGSDTGTTATWTPTIPTAGVYKIFMRWTAGANRPAVAPLVIKYNGGLDTTKSVNQQINNNTWVEIGQYNLSASSTDNYVKLKATGNGYTVADAVKFVRQPNLLFSDDFEDGTSAGWTALSGSWGVVTDGSQVYKQTGTSGEGLSVAGSTGWTDYSVQAKVKLYDMVSLAASGIIARYTDNNNYYMLRLHQSGQLQLYKKVGGTFIQLAYANVSVATNTTYTLKLTVNGSSLTGYLNSSALISTTDSSFASGEIGARTYTQTASFDDFSVTVP